MSQEVAGLVVFYLMTAVVTGVRIGLEEKCTSEETVGVLVALSIASFLWPFVWVYRVFK